jgi:uncharacterized repeat protein (TIGR03803 family)
MKPNGAGPASLWRVAIPMLALVLAVRAQAAPKYSVLHNFGSGHDGGTLNSPLVLDGAGDLYGVTVGGGTGWNGHGGGTAFELSLSGGQWKETALHEFCSDGGNKCTDGYTPLGPMAFDPAGNLYGTTASGGGSGEGVVFELTPGSPGWGYNILYEAAFGDFVRDRKGNLYGVSGAGAYKNGAVAELSSGSDGWTYTELYSFTPQESFPESALIFDGNGSLYGTTYYGGDAFKLSPPGETGADDWTFLTLHHFPSFHGDGASPYAGLVFDASGNLYGATESGGTVNQACPQGCGTIFQLTPDGQGGWNETILHRFPNFKGGFTPLGTLTFDKSGNIYGTTVGGGAGAKVCFGGCGTVFKMTPLASGKWTYTVLHRFTGPDGAGPQAGVTLDSKGNIYGTTYEGGSHYYGVVFEITP